MGALVFVVSWFSEGITPRLRMEGITLLDQSAQEATTIGAVGLYAPVAPGSLTFSGATEATPLFEPQVDDPGSNRRLVWTGGGGQSSLFFRTVSMTSIPVMSTVPLSRVKGSGR